ncbi:MAG: hypothetical protein K2L14_01365 [Duncaniella sp.]|nr:hypothetical protein [Duncaniella sp.]
MKKSLLKATMAAFAALLCGGAAIGAMYASGSEAPSAPAKAEAVDATATWDFADKTIMEATMAFSGTSEAGTVACKEGNGIEMTVLANGASFRDNGNNIQVREGAEFRIPVISTEDVVTVAGYPGYSYFSISGGEEQNGTVTYKAKMTDVQRGYVSVISTNANNYYYSLSVEQKAPKALLDLDNAPATATFKFDLGTEKQTAEFDQPDYFLSSKVTYGEHLSLDGKDNKGNGQTWFMPASQQSSPEESNAIRFLIQPKHGLKFMPTKVSFKTTRYGTDGGSLDVAWQSADGTTVSLATGIKPQRDNATPNMTECEYEVTGATSAEGPCGILINLYALANGKRIGFCDVVIEGTVTGQEKEVPMLASFTANEVTYNVDDVFEPNGDIYEGIIEIAAAGNMISATNPVTDLNTIAGTVGELKYEGDADKCDVTIPVSLADITINYVLHFVRKPYFTVSYFNTDGSAMGSQEVEKDAAIAEFAVDYATGKAEQGYKVRGWYLTPTGGQKATVNDVITAPVSLYAYATPVEEASTHLKYEFNLADKYFYPEDHEAFNTENGYFHDTTHGWAFKDGDVITLLVGPKATVAIGLCRYGYGTDINVTDAEGKEVATVPAKSADEIDGEVVAFDYEGQPGLVTLTLHGDGELYIHNVKITNTTEVTYNQDGQWFYVTPGDAQSLLDAIEAISAYNTDRDAARAFLFVPDGTYDLKETVLTNIYGHNISIIGQSMEGTVIVNQPHYTTEGIATTATLMNTGTNLYLQDLTIQNALDYYATIGNQQVGGRAVAFWDKGINTVCKNVELISCQDTYYSNNLDGTYYWENCNVHGTVDFFCGEGTMLFTDGIITVEPRNADGKGECTLTAPATKAGNRYGYVFLNNKIVNKAASYNYGRAWSNEPRCAYINTTVADSKLSSARWTANGMNVYAKEFVEYNTMDEDGKVVSPSTHVMTFIKGESNTMETILTPEQAAEFTVEKIFPEWRPDLLAVQAAAPVCKTENGTITWAPVEGAIAYAVFADGKLEAITEATSHAAAGNGVYTVRSINKMGGMGVAANADASGIISTVADAEVVSSVFYNVQGQRVDATYRGVVIRVDTRADGTTVTRKTIAK